ncbi:PfkB family carbohydrate kinase [Halapricum desulfuricans]|uniref:Fructose-1-phosphate kinase or kinase (PfkB) n=1 Tax=Halapricum desulfuricans TaxID=2841257 RepID=A0A897N4B9_9EURY|nr:PfkB family carbohydrate kinase [Halapricum desulfuricans]QSG07474.1 Fructose-1-phosphate kinase or kinase (PfkB) [Halapricum desulfuricans]QSG10490.1 Fructose-1-phosphate kinase or kinase (PfkB) [Halapricum desulfuricans]
MLLTLTPNPAVDQTIEMDEPLEPDTVQKSANAQFDSGGGGINLSQFVHALGGETVASGITGGFTGYFIEQDLKEFGIPTDFCTIESAPTRINSTILVPERDRPRTSRVTGSESSETVEYQIRQAGPAVTDAVIDQLVETVREHEPEILVIAGSLPPGMEPEAVDRLATAGDWETAVNVHGDVLLELEETYEYCRTNQAATEMATGRTIDSITDCEQAALEIQAMGFERVVASMGSEGAVMITPEQTLYSPAVDVDVVDTKGAGDALFGAILWAYEQGWDDTKALRAGVATAWKLVTVKGSTVTDLSPQDRMDKVHVWEMS